MPVHDGRLARLTVEHLRIRRTILLLHHLPQSIINQVRAVDAGRVAPVRVPSVGIEVVGEQVPIRVIGHICTGNRELICDGRIGRQKTTAARFYNVAEGIKFEELLPVGAAIHAVAIRVLAAKPPQIVVRVVAGLRVYGIGKIVGNLQLKEGDRPIE